MFHVSLGTRKTAIPQLCGIVLRVSVIPALDLKEGSAIGLWPGSPGI